MITADRLPPEPRIEPEWTGDEPSEGRFAREKTVGEMLLYPGDRAAGLMTLEFAPLRETEDAATVLAMLQDYRRRPQDLSRLFVVDSNGVLAGAVDLTRLRYAPPYTKLREIMDRDVVAVDIDASYWQCAALIDRHDATSLPVVDRTGRLKGVIAVEDMARIAEKKAAQDILRMLGLRGEDHALAPFRNSLRGRFPWQLVNLATVLLAGLMISLFEHTIDRLALLAVFIPVIVGQAGITGTQTLTLVVRSLALKEVTGADARRLLASESALAAVSGAAISILLATIVWTWRGDVYLSLVVGSAMWVSLVFAAATGVIVPLSMKAMRIDPASSSTVVITTITDIVGIASYLGLATWLLALLKTG